MTNGSGDVATMRTWMNSSTATACPECSSKTSRPCRATSATTSYSASATAAMQPADSSMNFGPLNRQGGKRRLNVATNRAREQVIVVSSVRAADFGNPESDGGPKSEGPRLLQAYLDYAERGTEWLTDQLEASQGDFESPFEREVAGLIRSFGFDAVPQVGASRYRIDIGVRSAVRPGRFSLGVECDGAMYHSAKTARDRDRLRQRVLENLGWRIHRIWSQDWFRNRGTEEAPAPGGD